MADANGSSGEGYAGAAVMCLSELEHPGPAATALGAFSVFFSTLVGIPQAYKIYKLKSARGVSFLTLGLGNIGSFLYVLNLTILHYNQITLSLSRDFAFWAKAQRSLVFVWVELFNAISMLAIYPVAAYYVRDDPCPLRVPSLGIDWEMGMKDAVFYWFLAQALIVFPVVPGRGRPERRRKVTAAVRERRRSPQHLLPAPSLRPPARRVRHH